MAEHVLRMIPQDTRKTMQLPVNLPVAVGCRYEISLNVDVSDGLANGAGGILKKIQLTSNNNSASGFIWIKFDDVSVGSQARAHNRTLFKHDIEAS
jgi:hypothetical protein